MYKLFYRYFTERHVQYFDGLNDTVRYAMLLHSVPGGEVIWLARPDGKFLSMADIHATMAAIYDAQTASLKGMPQYETLDGKQWRIVGAE